MRLQCTNERIFGLRIFTGTRFFLSVKCATLNAKIESEERERVRCTTYAMTIQSFYAVQQCTIKTNGVRETESREEWCNRKNARTRKTQNETKTKTQEGPIGTQLNGQ